MKLKFNTSEEFSELGQSSAESGWEKPVGRVALVSVSVDIRTQQWGPSLPPPEVRGPTELNAKITTTQYQGNNLKTEAEQIINSENIGSVCQFEFLPL